MDEGNGSVRAPAASEPTLLPPAAGDGGIGCLLGRLLEAQTALARERAAAPDLVAELLSAPPSWQEELLRRDQRFHTWGVCELLLRQSVERAERDPATSGHLAALALAGAGRLDGSHHPGPLVQDLAARAWAGVGEACLRRGELRGAEEALSAAAVCLAGGTGDLLVEARLLLFEGLVRRDQDRRREALALLKQAAARYLAVNEPELLARTLLLRDEIRNEESRPAGHAPGWIVFEPTS